MVARAPHGFKKAETFPLRVGRAALLRNLMPLLIATYIGTFLGIGLLIVVVGLPAPAALVLAVVIGGAVDAVIVSRKRRELEQRGRTSTLTLSPHGATMVDPMARIEIAWHQLVAIGGAGPAKRPVEALVGTGTMTLAADAPASIREDYGSGESDPDSGLPLCGIPLPPYDLDWRRGRIGEWIRAYRPDLLDPAQLKT